MATIGVWTEPPSPTRLTLPEVAQELGVTRSAVYLMIRDGRLAGMQCGPRWHVRREDLEAFKQTYDPAPTAGRRFGPRNGDYGPAVVLELLHEWGSATTDELAEILERHPGNIRKYLKLLEHRGHATRDDRGTWSPTIV